MFNDIMTIVNKELARVFTDRKLVFTTFILPALSLVLIYSVMGFMIQKSSLERQEHQGNVAVIGAPDSFIEYIRQHEATYNIKIILEQTSSEASLKQSIYDGKLDSLVVFETGFDKGIQQFKAQTDMPNINTFYNPTVDYSDAVHGKLVNRILPDFEKQLLISRFGDERYLKAFSIDLENTANQLAPVEKMSGDLLGGLVPFLLSIFLFTGGMGIGMDLISGEKERGTMATLLVTPIKREAIAFGKILSLAIVALISTASSLLGMLASFPFLMMAMAEETGETAAKAPTLFLLSPTGVIQFLILSVFLTLIYVGLICMVSVYANSTKEAGTMITPAYMAIMVLGLVSMFTNEMPQAWVFATPVYGTLLGMKYALSAELTWGLFGLNILISACVVCAIIWIIRQMFNSEKIMFGA